MRTQNFAKDVAALVAAVLVVFAAAISDDRITLTEAVNMAIAFVTAAGVIVSKNGDGSHGELWRYLRGIIAFAGAGLALLASGLLSDGITLSEWTQVALAGLGALGVVALPDERTPTPELTARVVVPPEFEQWSQAFEQWRQTAGTDPSGTLPASTFDPRTDDVTFRPGAVRRTDQQ